MIAWRPGGTIFFHSMALAVGSAVVVAILSIAIIWSVPLPNFFLPSTFEVARLLKGEPIRSSDRVLRREVVASRPSFATQSSDAYVAALRGAIARQLGVDADAVAFQSLDTHRGDASRRAQERVVTESAALYRGDPRYSPLIQGRFRAALHLPDGRWAIVFRDGSQESSEWQWGFIKWIVLALVLMAPVAWLFSARLARPIQALADSADKIGEGGFERVNVSGPAEVRRAGAAFNEMQARVEHSLKQRTFVIGAIAHDLRTPLARLAFLLADAPEELRSKVDGQVDEMESMIRRTLDFVRSETVVPRLKLVDLRLLLEGVVDDFADRGADAHLAPGAAAIVRGDAELLTRLFANLVSNALKYGAKALVELTVEGDKVIVDVTDAGPGLVESELDRVFEPFYRTEASRGVATGGIGLGLAIVRSLAQAHQGTARLLNAPSGGLIARIELRRDEHSPG